MTLDGKGININFNTGNEAERVFTILEVLLVVVLIGVLAEVVIPRYMTSSLTARVHSCEMNRSIINKSTELFFLTEGTWPMDSLSDIRTNSSYFPDGIPTCPVDISSYQLAPLPSHRVTGHAKGSDTHSLGFA